MTVSSSISNKIEQIPIQTSPNPVQLPDIIPNPSILTQPISIPRTTNEPIIPDDHVRCIFHQKIFDKF
jgi:hypothetical protein